jgi:tripartite-type tricarboxylate transporter receptor subunit TctC
VDKLHAATFAALADAPTKRKLEDTGMVVLASAPRELADMVKADMAKWAPVIKEAGISLRE